jgi:hypothetical protein
MGNSSVLRRQSTRVRCTRSMANISIHLASVVALAALCAGQSDSGIVHTYITTSSTFDVFTDSPSPAQRQWFEDNAWRMLVYSPYFDHRLSWYPNGWVYLDLYAIYVGSPVAAQHPDWILRDQKGNPLYIPYDCSGGTCPQYAGDVTNADFRAYQIAQAASYLGIGYRGLWLDDVNLEFRVSNGSGNEVAPIDPQTGQQMSLTNWEGYISAFTAQFRAAFPNWEIVHNVIWYAGGSAGTKDPSVKTEINAADYLNLERGVVDPGLTGGTGQYSFTAFLAYIDSVHQLGRGVVLDNSPGQIDYALASYFLISDGSDGFGSQGLTPDTWPASFSIDLGAPVGPRGAWNGLLYRLFANGMVLVNPPSSPRVIVRALASLKEKGSNTNIGSFTLDEANGVVLLYGSAPHRPSPLPWQ